MSVEIQIKSNEESQTKFKDLDVDVYFLTDDDDDAISYVCYKINTNAKNNTVLISDGLYNDAEVALATTPASDSVFEVDPDIIIKIKR